MKRALLFFLILVSCKQTDNNLSEKKTFGKNFIELNSKQKKDFLDSILPKVNDYKNDSIKSNILFDIAAEYYYLKEIKLSNKVSKMILKEAELRNDSICIGKAFYYIGDCYLDYQKDSSYFYYKESEKIFHKLKNKDRLAKVHYNKAYLLFYEGNYVESEIEVIKALNYLEDSKKLITKYRCYSLQGSNHLELEEFEKALIYFNQASNILIELQKQNKDTDLFYDYNITNTIDICNVYDKQRNYAKAIIELKKILNSNRVQNLPNLYHAVIGNLGYSLMKNEKYEESKKYFKKAIELTKKNKNTQGYLYKIINYGEYHLLTKDTIEAKKYFNEALCLARNLKSGKEVLITLDFLSATDKTNATGYKSEYIRINDSITKKQRENREKFARIEYETGRVEEANKVLSNKNLLLLLGFAITIVAFLIVLIIKNRFSRRKELYLVQQKEKANEELSNITKEFQFGLVKAKEEEQDRISKELHDGIVNQIYGIRMILGSLNRNTDEESQKKRSEYLKELHKLETEIRALSHDLNSDFSKYVGEFKFLLEQLAYKNNEIGNTIFNLDISSNIDWNTYSALIKINIYRILQELLQNVNKHAEAKNCYIGIFKLNNNLIVEVKDDGKGFDIKNASSGIGINNIKERLKTIKAELKIESTIDKGTILSIRVNNQF